MKLASNKFKTAINLLHEEVEDVRDLVKESYELFREAHRQAEKGIEQGWKFMSCSHL